MTREKVFLQPFVARTIVSKQTIGDIERIAIELSAYLLFGNLSKENTIAVWRKKKHRMSWCVCFWCSFCSRKKSDLTREFYFTSKRLEIWTKRRIMKIDKCENLFFFVVRIMNIVKNTILIASAVRQVFLSTCQNIFLVNGSRLCENVAQSHDDSCLKTSISFLVIENEFQRKFFLISFHLWWKREINRSMMLARQDDSFLTSSSVI